jgi:hypothetical protein
MKKIYKNTKVQFIKLFVLFGQCEPVRFNQNVSQIHEIQKCKVSQIYEIQK